MYPAAKKIQEILGPAQHILVLQADNPDVDSLASALALEQLLGEQGKKVSLYGALDVPAYLRYLSGWDRVSKELPPQFDASIVVDASTLTLLQKLSESGHQGWVAAKPCIVLDHHAEVANPITFATVTINDTASSSTGEVIYKLAKQLDWKLDAASGEDIMTAILADTQGLTNDLATAETYRILAELIELGVKRPELEDRRREYAKMQPEIFKYKANLIKRTEFLADGKLALVEIPQEEINTYSPLYNPAPLIQTDMLQTTGVAIALVFKLYGDGKILCAIRCNSGYPIAADLAVAFGGGGHRHASGFKITNGRPFGEIKAECIQKTTELLDNLNKDASDEIAQHSDA